MRALVLLTACLAASAVAQSGDDGGYLQTGRVPDGITILPPPPAPGSAAANADRAIFKSTRRLQGTARWRIATDDVTNAPLDRYACALGMQLTPRSAPATARLLDRADTGPVVDPVKDHYHTRRPYLGNDAPICEAKTPHLAGNGDYPSGHAANGWLEALILAALAPDHATGILARGRAYGESRVVCGSHSLSAVRGGWMAGSAMFAALNGSPAFRRDFESAAHELAVLGATAPRPDPKRCADEQRTLATRPW